MASGRTNFRAACKQWFQWAHAAHGPAGGTSAVHAPLEATNWACSSALVSLNRGVSALLPGTQSVRPSSVPSPAASSALSWSRPVHAAAKPPGAREEKSEAQAEGSGREAFKEASARVFSKDNSSTRFQKEVRKAYEKDMADAYGEAYGTRSEDDGMGERSREALDPAMNSVDAEDEVEPRVTHRVVASTTVVEETTAPPASSPVQGEHNYGAKYATRSSEEGFGTRMGQDDEQNVDDPALHAVDAELASKPVPPKQGEASYGDHYHTRSSEEGFGTRMGQDDQPDDPKLHETTN